MRGRFLRGTQPYLLMIKAAPDRAADISRIAECADGQESKIEPEECETLIAPKTPLEVLLVAKGKEAYYAYDEEERNAFKLLLGKVYDQMLEDGVRWAWLRHAALTCLMWVNSGVDTAEQYWASAGDPERLARNRAERRSKQQGSSAAAKSTRQRASMNGTSHGQGTGNPQRQGNRKSRGKNSSKSGR